MAYRSGLASSTYMEDGGFILTPLPNSDLRAAERRVSRVRTLDGGVVLNDSGFSHGDRTLRIRISSSRALWDRLWALFRTAATVTLSLDDGCYRGALSGITEAEGRIELNILVREKIS